MVNLLVGILINRITWEVKQLIAEFEKNQIKYELLNNQKVYYKLSREKDLKSNFDLILERSLSYLRGLYSCAILETKGYKVINNYECLTISGNKLLTSLKLIEKNIPTPETYIAFKDNSAINAIDGSIGYPVILKPIIGSWGRLIAKIEDYNSATANLQAREIMGNVYQKIYYLQEYIVDTNSKNPTDFRVFVIGDKCVAVMGRFSPDKDFRSNIAVGGTAKPVELTPELEKLSIQASRAINGEIIGVDLMFKKGNLNVIEINGTPQFKGIVSATKINIASEIVEYIMNKYK